MTSPPPGLAGRTSALTMRTSELWRRWRRWWWRWRWWRRRRGRHEAGLDGCHRPQREAASRIAPADPDPAIETRACRRLCLKRDDLGEVEWLAAIVAAVEVRAGNPATTASGSADSKRCLNIERSRGSLAVEPDHHDAVFREGDTALRVVRQGVAAGRPIDWKCRLGLERDGLASGKVFCRACGRALFDASPSTHFTVPGPATPNRILAGS